MSEITIVGSATPIDLNSGHLTNTVNVIEVLNGLNKEIESTKLQFPELDEIEVRDLIITKLLLKVSESDKESEELKDFCIWLTGCDYDFTQHEYFIGQRDRLLKSLSK